jgi:hypothetical protein
MRSLLVAAGVVASLVLASCGEPPEPGKVYAGKEDAKPYAGDAFKGDKQKWESTLAARADRQNEYLRTGDAKK